MGNDGIYMIGEANGILLPQSGLYSSFLVGSLQFRRLVLPRADGRDQSLFGPFERQQFVQQTHPPFSFAQLSSFHRLLQQPIFVDFVEPKNEPKINN